MGNTSGSTNTEAIEKRNEIRKLGERYPFGDDDLRKLVSVYESIGSTPSASTNDNNGKSPSFLLTLALECNPLKEDASKVKENIQQLEENILPPASEFDDKLKEILVSGDLETFLEGISRSQRRGTRTAAKFVFELCCNEDKSQANAFQIVDLGYRLCLAAAYLKHEEEDLLRLDKDANKKELQSFADALLAFASSESADHMPPNSVGSKSVGEGCVSVDTFLVYIESKMPIFGACVSTFLHAITFPSKAYPASHTSFSFPRLKGQASAFFRATSSPHLFSLACFSPSLSGQWHRLYTSDTDGISFNRLLNALLGYSGPTLILIKESEQGGVFGAYSSSTWKESKDFCGDSDCFLFSLFPTLSIYRARGHKRHYVYCNPASRSKGYDELPHGIGFGGSFKQLRLFLSETFDDCIASSSDLTYEEGPLLPPPPTTTTTTTSALQTYLQSSEKRSRFDLHSLEVWGVGGDAVVQHALQDRKEQRKMTEANIQKARKVDKAQFLDDFNSGLIESKAFKHKAQVHGHEVSTHCADDDL